MIKRLFSHTAIYGLAPHIVKIASFFSLPLITSQLTELDYGVSGVLGAYTSAISVFSTLGLNVILVNSFFKSSSQYKWAWRQLYGFLNIWNLFYALILAILIYVVIPDEASDNKWTILLLNVGPLVFFGQTSVICSLYYQLNQKPFQIVTRSIIFGFLSIGLNVLFIVYYKMGYMGWFWSAFIIGMLTNLSYFYPLNFVLRLTPIFNFKWRLIKNSLKVSLPMIPHYYSVYLLKSSDKMIMDVMHVSTSSIGRYNVAYTVANFISSLGNASGKAISPLLNGFYKIGDDKSARNLIFVLQGCFFVMTFILCLWMKELFSFLIRNENLAQMYYLGIILVMAYNYRPMYYGANAKLMFAEKTNVLWKVTFGAGLINIILNLLLIPIFGFEVAAITTFIGYMFMGYSGFYFKVFKEINSANYYPLFWIAMNVVITVITYFAVELPFGYKIIMSLLSGALGILFVLRMNKFFKKQ